MTPPFTAMKTKDKRKLAARIIFDICSTNFELLSLVSEIMRFSPLTGKVCLNSLPKALTDKFNSNHVLYDELKRFIENSTLLENKTNSFWTFPEFKPCKGERASSSQSETKKDVVFPDPKYYMIGLYFEKQAGEEEQDTENSDGDTTHTATKENLKQTPHGTFGDTSAGVQKKAQRNLDEILNGDIHENLDRSWKHTTYCVNKPSLCPIDTNKK